MHTHILLRGKGKERGGLSGKGSISQLSHINGSQWGPTNKQFSDSVPLVHTLHGIFLQKGYKYMPLKLIQQLEILETKNLINKDVISYWQLVKHQKMCAIRQITGIWLGFHIKPEDTKKRIVHLSSRLPYK